MAIELAPTRGAAAPERGARQSPRRQPGRITPRERQFFLERLALLLETGNSLHRSLDLLAGQATTATLAAVIGSIRDDVAGGLPLSQAMGRHPGVFSSTHLNLVAAAEQGGFMAEVLRELMAMEENAARLRSTLVGAFTYPAFLIVFSLGVVVFVLAVVFPKFAVMFNVIRDQLPWTTLVLMGASNLMSQYWGALTAGAGALAGAGWYLARRPAGERWLDRLKVRLPGLRVMFTEFYLVQSMRVMGLSLTHGVSVPDALRACRDVVRNHLFREFMDSVADDVQQGHGLAAGFVRSELIPPLTRQMVATAEESGNLPLVMTRIADFYERELTRRLTLFAKLVEPVLLLVMGVVVGLIVASLILPIFKLSKAVG